MAQFQLFGAIILPESSYGIPGQPVVIYWDDVTESIVVYVNNILVTSDFVLGFEGVDWQMNDGSSSVVQGAPGEFGYYVSAYSFCDGTTLTWFKMIGLFPMFPFAEKILTEDSPVCGTVVCDILFNGPVLIIPATAVSTIDGQIKALASSSNGVVKYGLTDFNYNSGGQLSGDFLVGVGHYTVYAKDVNGCTAQVNVFVFFSSNEQEHYRATWKTLATGQGVTRTERLRIYEREYVGSVVEIGIADVSPLYIQKPKQGELNDKLFPIHPTNAEMVFISEYDYQFLPLFTQDNKKFRTVYEVDEGSGFVEELQWFVAPSVYQANFTPGFPHVATIAVGDNVKELEDEDFNDGNGNLLTGRLKVIKIIAYIMKRTGLNLKIRSGINIFEVNHTINSDGSRDPLDQTYIDVDCYRDENTPFKCWDVLAALLKPFGARILQSNNQWIIEEIDRAYPSYDYRVFDSDGFYESNGTFNSIIDVKDPEETDRATLEGQGHSQEIIPAYGKISIVSKLNYVGTIRGGFEKADLLSPTSEIFGGAGVGQGVFTSEEGFKDWTLRLNGTAGVSFGRVEVGKVPGSPVGGIRRSEVRQQINFEVTDLGRSVGAFFFNVKSWQGNLRDAYIESAEKPYQYGPGDELKLRFEFATPPVPQFEFMVLRFLIKVGSVYLQQDGTWDAAEYLYRAYPSIQGAFQSFELSMSTPETTAVVDSTIQIRIYYYARHFFDFGKPNNTGDIADGIDGQSLIKSYPSVDIVEDFRCDVRDEYNSSTRARRLFYELRDGLASEDIPNVTLPNDYNSSTNAKAYHLLKSVQDNDELTNRNRGLDVKFYVDNISVDALINGQAPPTQEITALTITEYIQEELTVDLYNSDLPNITNAKNMYNNIFRLADGTPTKEWFRTGVNERLTLQKILLKVLAANHSAPTFRLTGSFINEFKRIGINNYLRITKEGAALSLLNTGFAIDLDEWTGDGDGEAFVWNAGNGGSAQVTLSGVQNSERRYQEVSLLAGGHIKVTVDLHTVPGLTNSREDVLWLLFYKGNNVIYTEKLITLHSATSASDEEFSYIAFLPKHVTRIGFYIRKVAGSGTCVYQLGEFGVEGIDVQEIYQIVDYNYDARMSIGIFELMQMSKTYISLAGIDTGGNNQSGGGEGSPFSGDFNNDFGGDYNTILN